jgi:hypothetical protein
MMIMMMGVPPGLAGRKAVGGWGGGVGFIRFAAKVGSGYIWFTASAGVGYISFRLTKIRGAEGGGVESGAGVFKFCGAAYLGAPGPAYCGSFIF